MARTTANDMIRRAGAQLDDRGYDAWHASELLDYLNEGLRATLTHIPQAFARTQVVSHQPGTRQQLPVGSAALIRVVRAINANGSAGRAAVPFDFNTMSSVAPDWHSAPAAPVRQYAYDPNDPRVYWVYPPAPPGSRAEIEHAPIPPLLGLEDELPIDERLEQALLDYMLYRAYSKDSEYAGEDGRAAMHYAAYLGGVGGTAQ